MAWRIETVPWPFGFQSRNWWLLPGRLKWPGQKIVCSGVMTPYLSAASAKNGLTVEPGGYAPRKARLISGLSMSFCKASYCLVVRPRAKALGSKPGVLAKAITSPL